MIRSSWYDGRVFEFEPSHQHFEPGFRLPVAREILLGTANIGARDGAPAGHHRFARGLSRASSILLRGLS